MATDLKSAADELTRFVDTDLSDAYEAPDRQRLARTIRALAKAYLDHVSAHQLAMPESLQFEAGKFYRRVDGALAGPLQEFEDALFPLLDPLHNESYTLNGKYFAHLGEFYMNLVPGEVAPPASAMLAERERRAGK